MHEASRECVLRGEPEAAATRSNAAAPPDVSGLALAMQRTAGNRATARWASRTGARLQRQQHPKRDAADTVGAYMDDDDWARAAWALGQMSAADIRTRVSAMSGRERRNVIEGARMAEPASWVDTIVTVMVDVDRRNAVVGSLQWARWKHEWARAHDWFHALSLEDGRNVARDLDFTHEQLLQVIGDSAYLKQMFPDPWAYVSRSERMRHAMELLVDTYHYPVNGAAGIVGNLMGESGLIPSRVEGSAESTPMRAQDSAGNVTDFTPEQVKDRGSPGVAGPKLPGAGIAQWTSSGRRSGLFAGGAAILYDMDAQMQYLTQEMHTSYSALETRLLKPTVTVQDAADDVLEHFEVPADPEQSRAARRAFAATAAQVYTAAHPPAATSGQDAGAQPAPATTAP